MAGQVLCARCGARSSEGFARFCAHCGAELPAGEAAQAPAPADRAARFRALRAHPGFEAAQRGARRGAPDEPSTFGLVLSVLLLACVGFILLIPSLAFPPVAVAVVVTFGLAIAYVVASAVRAGGARRAPLVRVPACVTGERTEIAGGEGGEGGAVRARHYLSLESERGTREEYEVDDRLAAQVAPGDLGVATFRGEELVDFEPLAV